MQYTTVQPVSLTADLYEFRDVDLPGGATQREYYFVRSINFTAYSTTGTSLMGFMDKPLKKLMRLRNVQDASGTQIGRYPEDPLPTWEVRNVLPVITAWGIVERNAMQLVKVQ